MDSNQEVVHADLASGAGAPGQARRLVREVLLAWRLPDLVDVMVLAVSELVTNAVRHGAPPVRMTVRRSPGSVSLDVQDGVVATPAVGAMPEETSESGRGMAIVAALASEVTCEQVPDDGKIVHAHFGITR